MKISLATKKSLVILNIKAKITKRSVRCGLAKMSIIKDLPKGITIVRETLDMRIGKICRGRCSHRKGSNVMTMVLLIEIKCKDA